MEGSKWFDEELEWEIGDGKNTVFWEDRWLGKESLIDKYHRNFRNSTK